MVKVSVEVRHGTARFPVAVKAQSIHQAMSIVTARYPDSDARVRFPIDPEGFFVEDLPFEA
jgi:hypothetical protein